MKKIGITGQKGFIGSHLYNTIGLFSNEFERVDFEKFFFDDITAMDSFVAQCDVIVHLAAINRHKDEQVLYETNVGLTQKLIESLKRTQSNAHVLVSSSTQEEWDNLYGKSKKESRERLALWADQSGGKVTGLIIPNVFGAFGKPYYNSFIATFCHQLTHHEEPTIVHDGEVRLIYVQELVMDIINEIRSDRSNVECFIPHTATKKVSEVLALLQNFKKVYFENGEIPVINDSFEHNLFNTYRSYIDYKEHYPVKFTQHIDTRGVFVEVIRLGIGGQCSFSTTAPEITRGNHFHTRKIERFAVIKGKAKIQLRKIDEDEVLDFFLDGNEPSYLDIPIWYTHNIKNIGENELVTIFWINEPYNSEDADTYFLNV
ncbi:NAD-dependent epimerase/dehydratase family protein [Riemerella anatipestifer]|uniref:polysaccharide biosynthesis C-terminal domain-containing protein n=1 Tax=Riemerella anatipestifer TaxID=34085 RepID=UPI00129E2E6E|nr:NAD-dependent epimerase/dehydratase family protein [Riemerella anatipestifer]MRM93451.1 NAD-dependent epimerase/dehydratase family protein [Riemerella anatipestifer]